MTGWPHGRHRDGGIDEITLPSGPGRLWLCGKHLIGPDPEAALDRVGADLAVCLCQRHELADRYPAYVEWIERHRPSRALWYPTPDIGALPVDQAVAMLEHIEQRLAGGAGVIVHCAAGIGRAGTTAAALLIRSGLSLPDALDQVRRQRPMGGPEGGSQLDLLRVLAGEHG